MTNRADYLGCNGFDDNGGQLDYRKTPFPEITKQLPPSDMRSPSSTRGYPQWTAPSERNIVGMVVIPHWCSYSTRQGKIGVVLYTDGGVHNLYIEGGSTLRESTALTVPDLPRSKVLSRYKDRIKRMSWMKYFNASSEYLEEYLAFVRKEHGDLCVL